MNAIRSAPESIETEAHPVSEVARINATLAAALARSPQAAAPCDLGFEAAATDERVSVPALGVEPARA